MEKRHVLGKIFLTIVEPIARITVKEMGFFPINVFAQEVKAKTKIGRLVDHMKSFFNECLPLLIA